MRLFGLIGYPLGHSFSAGYFAEKFRKEGITDSRYENFPIPEVSMLDTILKENPDLTGLNVTIPYKEAVIPFLHEMDPGAHRIGAVNTIKVRNRKGVVTLEGFNTDIYGFSHALRPHLHEGVRSALILGTGGASKAVIKGLEDLNIKAVIVSRDPEKTGLSYADLSPEMIRANLLIVNTTPLGTYPDIHSCPDIPYHLLGKDHILFDLVYNPAETLFMKRGKDRGSTAINGYEMLVLQAEKAWEIWNQT